MVSVPAPELWRLFQEKHQLTDDQRARFERYYELLVQTNELFNLTAITKLSSAIEYHFNDSLVFGSEVDLATKPVTIIDVGTGAGFPALPLKLIYPKVKLVLVEVSAKKRQFLEELVAEFNLDDVKIIGLDWRNFLRDTKITADYVLARASLTPDQLIHMFKPSVSFRKATLVYWAARNYQCSLKDALFFEYMLPYTVGSRDRKLIFYRLQG